MHACNVSLISAARTKQTVRFDIGCREIMRNISLARETAAEFSPRSFLNRIFLTHCDCTYRYQEAPSRCHEKQIKESSLRSLRISHGSNSNLNRVYWTRFWIVQCMWINNENNNMRSRRRARVHFLFFFFYIFTEYSTFRVQSEFLAIWIIELDSNQRSELQFWWL